MALKTKVFDLYEKHYKNLPELAEAIGMSVDQVYRVLRGKRNINRKFIVGVIKAFPHHKFDDLFYFASEPMRPKVWYDGKGDFLEVMFKQKEGYFQETDSDQVMKKVDAEGNIIGFSILKISSLKGKILDINLAGTAG